MDKEFYQMADLAEELIDEGYYKSVNGLIEGLEDELRARGRK